MCVTECLSPAIHSRRCSGDPEIRTPRPLPRGWGGGGERGRGVWELLLFPLGPWEGTARPEIFFWGPQSWGGGAQRKVGVAGSEASQQSKRLDPFAPLGAGGGCGTREGLVGTGVGAEKSQWKSALIGFPGEHRRELKGAPPLSLPGVGSHARGPPKLATQAREGDPSPYLKRGFLGERGGTVGGSGGQFFRPFCGLVKEHKELTLPRNLSAPTQQGHTVGPFDVLTA